MDIANLQDRKERKSCKIYEATKLSWHPFSSFLSSTTVSVGFAGTELRNYFWLSMNKNVSVNIKVINWIIIFIFFRFFWWVFLLIGFGFVSLTSLAAGLRVFCQGAGMTGSTLRNTSEDATGTGRRGTPLGREGRVLDP